MRLKPPRAKQPRLIEDDGLRDAVTRLGARAIDRAAGLREAAGAEIVKGDKA